MSLFSSRFMKGTKYGPGRIREGAWARLQQGCSKGAGASEARGGLGRRGAAWGGLGRRGAAWGGDGLGTFESADSAPRRQPALPGSHQCRINASRDRPLHQTVSFRVFFKKNAAG